MRGPCIHSYLTLIGTVSISEDGKGNITGVYLPCANLPPMEDRETPAMTEAIGQIGEYLLGTRREFELDLYYEGTDFQMRTMEMLGKIPYGELRTYGQMADMVGSPNASRAVGMVCARNPLPIVIPCHRVVPSSGGYGSYSGGASLKRRLINLEKGCL